MSDKELCDEICRRCTMLLERHDVRDLTLDNIQIANFSGRLTVGLLRPDPLHPNWTSVTNLFDSNCHPAEQRVGELRDIALPVLRRFMVLDDLSDV